MDTTRHPPRRGLTRTGPEGHPAKPPAQPQATQRNRPGPTTPANRPAERSGQQGDPTHDRTAGVRREVPAITDLDQLTAPAHAESSPPSWSHQRVHALGATTDLLTAARILRIGRTKAYQLAKSGDFPVRVTRIGRHYVIAVAHIAELLGLDEKPSS